jgi:hypothetical protein
MRGSQKNALQYVQLRPTIATNGQYRVSDNAPDSRGNQQRTSQQIDLYKICSTIPCNSDNASAIQQN